MLIESTEGERLSMVLDVSAVSLSPSLSVTEAVQVISAVGFMECVDRSILEPVDKDVAPTLHE